MGDIDQLVARIPPRSKLAAVRALLNRRGGQISAVESGTAALDEEARTFTGTHSDLAATYETAVREADAMADRRFEKAEAAVRLAVISRQIAEQEEMPQGLRSEESVLRGEIQAMDAAWQGVWSQQRMALNHPACTAVIISSQARSRHPPAYST